jgi:hypothetical protein
VNGVKNKAVATTNLRFGSMGWYNQDYEWRNPSLLATRRKSADFIDELMENMGDCEIPLKLIHDGTDHRGYQVVGKKGNKIVTATWTKDSAVSYKTHTSATGHN